MAETKRRNVTFELPEAEYELLIEESERTKAGSHHQRARAILLAYYGDTARMEAEKQTARIEHLTEMLRRLAYTMMVNVYGKGDEAASDAANAWIQKNMPREPD